MRRVLVVGAGISGLACARELYRLGVSVVVLEARDRIGGAFVCLSVFFVVLCLSFRCACLLARSLCFACLFGV